MVGCGNDGSTDADKGKTAAAPAKTAEVVIYTNADEEAQTAMKNALDKNGMKGAMPCRNTSRCCATTNGRAWKGSTG